MRLLILPHAGGSARGYCFLKKYASTDVSFVPLEPAGRGVRMSEPCFEDLSSCVSDLIEKNENVFWDGPYALFGHSMGTMLAVELGRQLREKGMPEPVHVFVSGKTPPSLEENQRYEKLSGTREEVVAFFEEKGMLPRLPDVTFSKKLQDILYHDIRMTSGYAIASEEYQFSCDITVLFGTEDEFLEGCSLQGWEAYTTGACEQVSFPGGHFYYQNQKEAFGEAIRKRLQEVQSHETI